MCIVPGRLMNYCCLKNQCVRELRKLKDGQNCHLKRERTHVRGSWGCPGLCWHALAPPSSAAACMTNRCGLSCLFKNNCNKIRIAYNLLSKPFFKIRHREVSKKYFKSFIYLNDKISEKRKKGLS